MLVPVLECPAEGGMKDIRSKEHITKTPTGHGSLGAFLFSSLKPNIPHKATSLRISYRGGVVGKALSEFGMGVRHSPKSTLTTTQSPGGEGKL